MDGITGYIAALSMSTSLQSVQNGASLKILKNVMNGAEEAGAKLVESLGEIPQAAEGIGSLLDVKA